MKTYRILCWNVNGIRAVHQKGFLDWLREASPDMLCIQETKAVREQLPPELREPEGYHAYFSSALRKGYSGVAIFTREEPKEILKGMGIPRFDEEGRLLLADFGSFVLYSVYFPNGKLSGERLQYKMDFYTSFLEHANAYKEKGKHVIVCGDINTAHKEIDLARPKENEDVSGFLPVERAWIDTLLESGYVDAFRLFESGAGHYTWWDYKTRARERNIGWRIDAFYVSEGARDRIQSSFILKDVTGSDHCPIGIDFRAN